MRAFFHGKYSGVFIPLWFGTGVAMALGNRFFLAYLFFVVFGLWSLGYWLNSAYLQKKRNALRKREITRNQDRLRRSTRNYRISLYGVSGLSLLLTGICLDAVHIAQVQYVLGLPEGELTPANEPSPQHGCRLNPPDALMIYFGMGAAASYAPANFTNHTIIKIGGHDLLSLNHDPKGVTVSAEIFDPDGILVEIDHGKFHIYRTDSVKHQRPDVHTLLVYDKWNNKRLAVRYLNSHAIDVSGTFFYPGYKTVLANENGLNIAGNTFTGGSCIGGSTGSDINVD
jgi:hypothetical protein